MLSDPDNPIRRVKVPYSEYPAAMVFYKMNRAGLLQGLPESLNVSTAWQFGVVHDDNKAMGFEEKFGVKLTSRFRHVPDSFARLLAKIGYCNLLCMLDPGDFNPVCLPYILGEKGNPSYVVGGTFEIATPARDKGYILSTAGFTDGHRLMLIAEIRLYANLCTPTYHVVVGDVTGQAKIAAALTKMGPIEVAPLLLGSMPSTKFENHWMPSAWPLPYWGAK